MHFCQQIFRKYVFKNLIPHITLFILVSEILISHIHMYACIYVFVYIYYYVVLFKCDFCFSLHFHGVSAIFSIYKNIYKRIYQLITVHTKTNKFWRQPVDIIIMIVNNIIIIIKNVLRMVNRKVGSPPYNYLY